MTCCSWRMRPSREGTNRNECLEWLYSTCTMNWQLAPIPVLPTLAMVSWSILVTILFQMAESNEWQHRDIFSFMILDTGTSTFLALSLILVLTMRVNQCYSRWWEGRQLWGSMVNRTRDLAGQARLWVSDFELEACILRNILAFVYSTKNKLRDEPGMQEMRTEKHVPGQVRLLDAEIQEAEDSEHMPVHILCVLRCCLSQAHDRKLINDLQLLAMDCNVTSLTDSMGGCERIKKTPFPLSYVSHLRTFIILYLLLLPLMLVDKYRWMTILVDLLVCLALMGVEHMSAEIEQPFGHDFNHLKLDAICATIQTNIQQISSFRQSLTADGSLSNTSSTFPPCFDGSVKNTSSPFPECFEV
ncbi:unnamed protein product [Polarella glacialis]|uniref:Bestrophin homolog n=1 Tax=Polarella glacialis TaxID=89957 RepID=A0A813IUZ4_POLGL|nr:unnamed protein product [Polarella glacialis]